MKRRILVVDDEILILKSVTADLKRSGYDVDTVENGKDALVMADKRTYDLLITDLSMEGMSGLELLAAVKEKFPNMPVIIITGYGELDSAIKALRLGAADYLLSGKKWAGPRKGINWAGYIAWAVGFVVAILPMVGGDKFSFITPAPVIAFVIGFVLYIVLAKAGLEPEVVPLSPTESTEQAEA